MTVTRADDGVIRLAGDCPVEDADTLLRLLGDDPAALVDWRGCTAAHAAVVQVLMALRPALAGPPAGEFLQRHVVPHLE